MLRAARHDEGNDDGARARGDARGRGDGVAAEDSKWLGGARGARRQARSGRGPQAALGRLAARSRAVAGCSRRRVRRDRGRRVVEVDGAGRRRRDLLRWLRACRATPTACSCAAAPRRSARRSCTYPPTVAARHKVTFDDADAGESSDSRSSRSRRSNRARYSSSFVAASSCAMRWRSTSSRACHLRLAPITFQGAPRPRSRRTSARRLPRTRPSARGCASLGPDSTSCSGSFSRSLKRPRCSALLMARIS